ETADNENKTTETLYEESSNANTMYEKNTSSSNQSSNPVSDLMAQISGLFAGPPRQWFGSAYSGGTLTPEQIKAYEDALNDLAAHAIAEEKNLLVKSIAEKRISQELVDALSLERIVSDLGYGHFRHLKEYQLTSGEFDLQWNSI